MTLLEVFNTVLAVKSALATGDYLGALRLAYPLIQYVLDAASGLKAGADDAELKAKVRTACEECIAAHGDTNGVGAWGDGTVLRLVLQILQTILPLVV